MQSRIEEETAKTQFREIMDLAGNQDQRFVVSRPDGPAVVIMSISDYLRLTIPAPDWLQEMWKHSKKNGLDAITMEEIDAEIAECRREQASTLEHAAG